MRRSGAQQAELGRLYDAFSVEYGIINGKANGRAFEGDSSYYLLCSLEILDEDRKLKRKGGYFQQTNNPAEETGYAGGHSERSTCGIHWRAGEG